jgi:hypothetical protein
MVVGTNVGWINTNYPESFWAAGCFLWQTPHLGFCVRLRCCQTFRSQIGDVPGSEAALVEGGGRCNAAVEARAMTLRKRRR